MHFCCVSVLSIRTKTRSRNPRGKTVKIRKSEKIDKVVIHVGKEGLDDTVLVLMVVMILPMVTSSSTKVHTRF